MGKIIKKKDIKPGSLKRFVWPDADSGNTADVSDDNVIYATLKKQPWTETTEEALVRMAEEQTRRAKLH